MPKTAFDLTAFAFQQATIEIRYDDAMLLWDRSGALWSNVKAQKPEIKVNNAKPNQSTFFLDDRYTLSSQINTAFVIDTSPASSLKEFIELSHQFLNTVMDTLEIKEITRIGFRLLHNKFYDDREKAANGFLEFGLMKIPSGKHFNIDGKLFLPQYAMVWEGKSTAMKVNLLVRDKKIDFDPSPNTDDIRPFHFLKHELMIDLDYYTLAPILRGQFNVSEWISQSYHLIKRDIKGFLGF
jgi:hypothetical protein